MSPIEWIVILLAALAAGAINALAGGGTLVTFPTLLALGIPAVPANITNTVALLPGYLGGVAAQRKDLAGQGKRLMWMMPAGALGGLLGGALLLVSGEELFRRLVPFLLLLASLLLASQDHGRRWVQRRTAQHSDQPLPEAWAALPVGLAGIYGGYFGAGLSVIVLATLGLVCDDTLTRLNASKQFISFAVNTAAAVLFVFSGQVLWNVALVMAFGALAGGALGGRLASRIHPQVLRTIVVAVGLVMAVIYFIKG
jgi:uncharacterized protein